MHRNLPAPCGACGRRLQVLSSELRSQFMSRGGSPSLIAQAAHAKAAGSHPVVVNRGTCKPSRHLGHPWRAPRTASAFRCPSFAATEPVVHALKNTKALWCQVHLGSSASAQSWLPRASQSGTLWPPMKDAALLLLVGSIAQCQQAAAGPLLPSRGSNPSIEGTSTSGLRPLAAAPHVKR